MVDVVRMNIRHFHTVVMVPFVGGRGKAVPVLLDPAGAPIVTVTQWVLTSDLKAASLRQAARHVGYLYDYGRALRQIGKFDDYEPHKLVHACLEALRLGTIDEIGDCPLGLFWRPKGEQHTRIRRDIARYANYLLEIGQGITDGPIEAAGKAWLQNHGGFLNYLSGRKSHQTDSGNGREDRGQKPSRNGHVPTSYGDYGGVVTAFPAGTIENFIIEGSRRKRKLTDRFLSEYSREFNVRDQLAKVAIFGGGLRSEELFHIFGVDIKRSNGLTDISLFHPQKGVILHQFTGQDAPSEISRAEYLWEVFRIHPRNAISPSDPLYCGWKNLLLLEAKRLFYTKVFWIDRGWGELFWALHRIYVRDYLSRMRLDHPYYFVCIDRENFGQPWTQSAFKDAWKSGLKRIGLKQKRETGTTPHGGRHAYGQTAANIGIDPRIRQVMMHHRNILSQLRYQRPDSEQVNREISLAQQRIIASLDTDAGNFNATAGVHLMRSVLAANESERSGSGHAQSKAEIFSGWFNDPTDPTGLFASWDFYQNLRGRHGL